MVRLFLVTLLILVVAVATVYFVFQHYRPMMKMLALNLERELTHPIQPPPQTLGLPLGSDDEITLGWVGHSTWIIEFHGTILITDPMFSKRAMIPRRMVAPALKPADITSLDAILITHAHSDHLDIPSLKSLPSQAKLLFPEGDKEIVQELPHAKISLKPNEVYRLNDLTVTTFQARHQGKRTVGNSSNLSLSYLLQKNNRSIVFLGDTAYTPNLGEAIRKECPNGVDAVIVPIASYDPEEFHKDHCTPEEAIQLALDMHARLIVPMHYETFILSLEPIDEPLRRFNDAAAIAQVSDRIRPLPIGGALRLDNE